MNDRVFLLKLLDAVESHSEFSRELWEGPKTDDFYAIALRSKDLDLETVADSIRSKLDAQEKAEWEAAYPHEKAFGGSD